MKKILAILAKTIGAIAVVALSTVNASAANGADTWVGNTSALFSGANWTGVNNPPLSGDSLVFGAAGFAGASLNNDITGLSVNNINFNGPGSFTFGGNGLTLNGALTDAATVNETFSGGIAIGSSVATAIKNTGSGTLALGALSAGSGGTVDFTIVGPVTTTTANTAGILGGWATTGNSVSSATTGDWVCTNSSGNIVTYTDYTVGTTIAGQPATANFRNTANATMTVSTTINSLRQEADVTLSSGQTLTLNSGGIIFYGISRWLKNAAGAIGGNEFLKSGLATGELFVHVPDAAANANNWTIWPIIADNLAATTLIKDGPGLVKLGNNNTYTGGTFVNGGTLQLGNGSGGGGTGFLRGVVTVNSGATLNLSRVDAVGYTAGVCVDTLNVVGGTVANTSGGNEGFLMNLNLTGGTVTSTGGKYVFSGGYGINSLASPLTSLISAPLNIQGASTIAVAQGNTASGNDLVLSGIISGAGSVTKTGAGTMVMSGTNACTGGTAISEGVLQIGDGISASASMVSNNIDIGVGASLIFANPGAATCAGVISSSSDTPVVKTGAGTLTLSGANTYSVPTIVSNGVIVFAAPQSLTGSMTVVDGAGVGVTATTDEAYYSPSSLTLGNSTGAKLQFAVYGTTTPVLNPTTLTINGTATVNISSAPFAIGASYPLLANYTGGTLALGTQPPGYFGELTVSGTTVSYTVTNISVDVWTAAVSTNWDTTTANWTNSLGGNLFAANDLVQFDDSAAGTSPLLVNITPSAVTNYSMLVSNTAKSYIIGGLAIGGASSLTKNGNNTLTLTGTNTFTGKVAILGGTLEIGNGGGGQLGAGTYSGAIDDETLLRYNSTNAQTLSGVISGPGALLVTNGTLTLNGAQNTFAGGATFTNATVVIGNGDALGTGTITANGGTLKWNYTAGNANVNNSIVVNGPVTFDTSSGNWTQNGSITGSGTITRGTSGTLSLYLAGDNSGFTGTYQDQVNGNAVTRITSPNAGSASARWIWKQGTSGRMSLSFGSGTISWGSMSGSGFVQQAVNATTEIQAGALGLNDIFSGVMQQVNAGSVLVFTKVGTNSMTLSGANTFLGGVNINGGILCVSNTSALSTAGNIVFGGGTLQYSGVSGVDYSPRIANSTAAITIDLNGTNVTYASALPASNTGGLALTNSTGASTNKLTITAASAYTGSTIINGGTLALSGIGAINSSTNITVGSSGTFDVSGVSYTLGGNQTLAGSGMVTGAVTTASSGSAILPGGASTVGTLTFQSNVNLSAGAAPVFDLGTSHSSGNDQIVVAGNLTLGASDAIHVNALNGSTPLDETADYVLFSVAGTTTMASTPILAFDNTPPADYQHYIVAKSGNNIVLHYLPTPPPVVTVIVTNTADGSTVVTRGQSVTVFATAHAAIGSISSVTADLTAIGGAASQPLTHLSGENWAYTLTVGPAAVVGNDTVTVSSTDTQPATGSGIATLTVNASSLTWDGSGADANWGTGGNWVGAIPPGLAGDSVTFTGSANTSPNLEANYNVAGVTFDGSASSFTNVSTTGKTLTLSGPVNNSSGNPQVFNLAVVMNGSPTIADSGAGITFAGPISGSGGLEASSGTVTLAGADTYTANTIIDGGAILKAGSSTALPNGSGKGNIGISGTLDINGTNAAVNGLSGSGTVDNTSTDPATLNIGNADVSSTFAGTIQNTGANLALVKTGAGTLTLNSPSTYSGGTTLSNGTLAFGNGSAFGTGAVTLKGGTLSWYYVSGNTVFTNDLVVNGAATFDVVNGNATFNGSLSGSGTLTRSAGVNPPVSLFLGGDNSGFTGTFQDQNSANSVVRFTTNTAGSASARWIFNQPQLTRTSLPTVAGTIQFGSMSGAGILSPNAAVATTVEVGALGLNDTFSGSLSETAGGTIALTKVGVGTLTMSGANNYTGPTIVSNGTLNVSSAKVSTGDFTLIDGTSLGVNLATNGVSLNMTSLTLGNNCTNSFTGINSTTVPAVADSGALTLSGRVLVNVQGTNFTVAQYPLISYSGITGAGGFVLGSLPAGVTANIITNGNAIVLNVSQVPVTGPVTITNSFSGNTLTLTWPAGQGWRLVSQTNSLSTGLNPNPNAWSTVPGYTDGSYSITTDPAKPTVFYRLVNP